ncbi:MAG: hypothetical protein ACK4NC_01865 [Candidatus Gracilibacteria bacterium]
MLQETKPETFIPIERVENIVGVPLEWKTFKTDVLRNTEHEEYNVALMRAVSHYIALGIYFPPSAYGIYFGPEYEEMLTGFISLAEKTNQVKYPKVPSDQICFEAHANGGYRIRLYLAETCENKEIFLTDIFLGTAEGKESLGNGIFDTILNNIEAYAKENGYTQIGLLAAYERNMHSFSKRGYRVDNTPMGEAAKKTKQGYPMTKIL